MAHAPDTKTRLRAAYIGGLPLDAAADKVGVPAGTARNWYRAAKAAGDDWDAFQKASLIVAGGGIEQALGRIISAGLLRCEALLEATAASEAAEAINTLVVLGDTVSKLRAASKGMMPDADRIGIETTTVKAFAELAIKLYPAIADKVLAAVEAYANGQR